jgi:hypothetical protein
MRCPEDAAYIRQREAREQREQQTRQAAGWSNQGYRLRKAKGNHGKRKKGRIGTPMS